MDYRVFKEGDCQALSQLMSVLGYNVEPVDIATRIQTIRNRSGEVFVAGDSAVVIGCVQAQIDIRLAEGCVGEIISLAVLASHQGLGVGKRLIKCAEAFLVEYGCETVRIRANSKRDNARDFYSAQGYSKKKQQSILLKHF